LKFFGVRLRLIEQLFSMALQTPLLLLTLLPTALASSEEGVEPAEASSFGCAAADGTCTAPDWISALQGISAVHVRRGQQKGNRSKVHAPQAISCEGPWCDMLAGFCALFDTFDADSMQRAVDTYVDGEQGFKMALTQNRYYDLPKDAAGNRSAWLLSKGFVDWTFEPVLEKVDLDRGAGVVTIVRRGTFSLHLNWVLRKFFSATYMQSLPHGKTFPYSTLTSLQNSDRGPSVGLFDVKLGGLSGEVERGWKIVDATFVKLG